jgi:hypothetical protein
MKSGKIKSTYAIIAKYFGIWRHRPWTNSLGKSSRIMRKQTPVRVEKIDVSKGRDFEELAKELGV